MQARRAITAALGFLRGIPARAFKVLGRLRVLHRLKVMEAFLAKAHPCPGCGCFIDLDAVTSKRATMMQDPNTGLIYVVCCWCRSRADGTPVRHLRQLGPGSIKKKGA